MLARAGNHIALALFCAAMFAAASASGQQFPIYKETLPVASLNLDRLFSESQFGKKVLEESRAKTVELSEENRRIEAELEREERDLTEKRKVLPAEDFRLLAEAFDQKVVRVRRTQNSKANDLGEQLDTARREFSERVQPILLQLMREKGITFILDEQAVVFALSSGDVTDEVIARVDAEIGATLDGAK